MDHAKITPRNQRGVVGAVQNMNETSTSSTTDDKPVADQTNISADEFVTRRMGERAKKSEAAKPETETPATDTAQKAEVKEAEVSKESSTEATKTEAKSEDVLSQVDLSTLTDEQITELAARGKSGLLKRVAELTALRRQAEEKAQSLEEFVSKRAEPSLTEAKVDNNPYSKLQTLDEVTATYQQVNEVIEWAEEVLDRAENLSNDENAAVVDGEPITKAQVKENLRKARKAKDKYLPAQFKELQSSETRKLQRNAFDFQARQELPWMDGEENDVKKSYQAMVADPRLKKLEQAVPELAPQLGYILAHAANSIHGRKSWSLDAPVKKSVTINAPNSPSSSAANSDRTQDHGEKHEKELAKRYQETGKQEDYVALRTAQIGKRKKL